MRTAIGGLALLAALVSPALAGETIHVTIQNLAYIPPKISAHVGDTIEWTNKDIVAHTATARNNAWDVNIPANGIGRLTVERAGDFAYFCRFHPNMTGEIVVAP